MTFEVTILGANAALPALGRFPTCQILNVNHRYYMIDCGEGAQMQAAHFGIKLARLHSIFISHLHGDHYLGLIGLLGTMSLQGRKKPLYLYAPIGMADILAAHQKSGGLYLTFELIFKATNTEVPELLVEDDLIKVYTFPLRHRIPCAGFRFEEKRRGFSLKKDAPLAALSIPQKLALKRGEDIVFEGKTRAFTEFTEPLKKLRTYAYCSDTIFDINLLPELKNVDLLYHEATFTQEYLTRAQETMHTTAFQAALLAKEAQVGKLLLGHYSSRYHNLDRLLVEAQAVFPTTEMAIEGQTFEVLHEV
ncbi:ribonuclease Z [Hugenholtzia roseola]|uniref:ribonuclease Z n=1 Tax=Hugenholtzia roseola TaxID=1002 RepID=UPI0003FF53BE|nr:ribonuclease Z [Hugenholtzia roseola]